MIIAQSIEQVGMHTIFVVLGSLLFIFLLLTFLLFFNWKREGIRGNLCPYTKLPMRLGIDVARSIAAMVQAFIEEQPQPENPEIDFSTCSYCPQTGRIFPSTVTKKEYVQLDWDFITKKWPGTFISWGALSPEERGVVTVLHGSLEGFQTEKSSSNPNPKAIEQKFAFLSPGPLYIDRLTKVVVGWKKVPGTRFEIFVVQQPQFHTIDETL